MSKSPKITIKFFLKQTLPQGTDDKGKILYPLYIMVTFKRKNTQIKSKYGLPAYASVEEVAQLSPGLMVFEENQLRKVIEYEIEKQGEDKFSLVGLGKKHYTYTTSIHSALESYMKAKLQKAIIKTRDELQMVLSYESAQATFSRLHKAATLLFKDFDKSLDKNFEQEIKAYSIFLALMPEPFFTYDFPTVIEWMNGELPMKMAELYFDTYKRNDKNYEAITNLLEEACQKVIALLPA